jgi:hypothetical protein
MYFANFFQKPSYIAFLIVITPHANHKCHFRFIFEGGPCLNMLCGAGEGVYHPYGRSVPGATPKGTPASDLGACVNARAWLCPAVVCG